MPACTKAGRIKCRSATERIPAHHVLSSQRRATVPAGEEEKSLMGSTSDKISGKANEIAGKAKQAVGKAAGDNEMRAKGTVQEAKGKAQVATGKVKEKVKGAVDRM
jgi:uncharacterized protein YjbJ (UPF0337 family)